MRLLTACVVLIGCCASMAEAQVVMEMTPERVQEAIAYANAEENPQTFYDAWSGSTAIAEATTPFSRVVALAVRARRLDKQLSPADIPAEVLAPELHIRVSAGADLRVENIVIMPKGEKDRSKVIQPTKTYSYTEQYKNMMGAVFDGEGMIAVFPLSVLQDGWEVRVLRSNDNESKGKFKVKRDVR